MNFGSRPNSRSLFGMILDLNFGIVVGLGVLLLLWHLDRQEEANYLGLNNKLNWAISARKCIKKIDLT